jgi:hypothetical protein
MADLVVELTLPPRFVIGDLLVGDVAVRNVGTSAITVSAWLGLNEGDLWVIVRDPSGRDHTLHGRHVLDVLPREATLTAGQAIARGLQLSITSDPGAIMQPGVYRVTAVYAPGPGLPTVSSNDQTLVVEQARAGAERGAAAQADPAIVADAVALGDVDPGSAAGIALEGLASGSDDRAAPAVARVVLAAAAARRGADPAWDEAFRGMDPLEVARLATALQPPAVARDDPLLRAAIRYVAALDATPQRERAIAMLEGAAFQA